MDSSTNNYPGLKNLVTAIRKITSRLDIDSVLDQIVDALTVDLDGVYAAVWLVDKGDKCRDCDIHRECLDQESCLHLKSWSGRNYKRPGVKTRIPLGVLNVGVIGLSKSPHLSDDITGDPMITDREWVLSSGIKSFAGFPLLRGDKLLGVMAFFGDRPLSAELGDMLLCIAHQSAMAIADGSDHKKVRESEERYRTLIDGAIDAVFILGPGGRILAASRSATRLFGFDKDELSGMSIEDLDPGSFENLRASYPSLLSGETVTYTGNFSVKSGGTLPVEIKAGATIYNGDTAVQAFVRDITDRMKMERHKADFISMLTHDMKGPLSIIMGYSEVIKEQYWDEVPEFVKEGVEAIYRGGDKLLALVNDYLSLSKIESGTLTMHRYPTEICQLVSRAVNLVGFNAEQKGIEIAVSCPDKLPYIELDPKYMDRAIMNLLSNAVKYTPAGGRIELRCGMPAGGNTVYISVSDSGVGIPKEDLHKVFDKYYRVPGETEKGTGLGLAIVKSIVEGHGGTVEVESETGRGSTFTITIPRY